MSLRPDDRTSRGRSKSATRDRSRSRSNVRAPSPPSTTSYGYSAPPPPPTSVVPVPGSYSNGAMSTTHEVRSPPGTAERSAYFSTTSSAPSHYPPPPSAPYPSEGAGYTMGDYTDFPPHERPGYVPPQAHYPQSPPDDDLAYGDGTPGSGQPRHASFAPAFNAPHGQYLEQRHESISTSNYKYRPEPGRSESNSNSYTYQYAQPPERIAYTTMPQTASHSSQYSQTPQAQFHEQLPRTYAHNAYSQDAHIADITPGHETHDRRTSRPHRLSVDVVTPGLGTRMDRLSVSGNRPDVHALGGAGILPPPSPMLEAYHGTYQSISPMPLAIRAADDDDLDDLEPLSPGIGLREQKDHDKLSKDAENKKKRVTVYDAEEDAKVIAKALNHSKIDSDVLIDILPGLSHDQIWELRRAYKKQVKIQGKGINLPKHLKMKVPGMFGKAVYVTALGRWESEGYWANFWYQAHGSRRELLIESLMGRTNVEIRNIKDEFKDKRYSDSLTKCMEKELKMDKFRTAVMMVLEERRQEEQDIYPMEYRNRDVELLHRALTAPQGGESAMLEIIVRRSDNHLREVLKTYERKYQDNFARAALKKSNNLVGEVIAHILNGVINKPARDALLIQHAIKDIRQKNKDDDLRYELLVSRLVRLHWDKMHLLRVRREYMERCHKDLQQDIEEATREGDFREYMCELCEVR